MTAGAKTFRRGSTRADSRMPQGKTGSSRRAAPWTEVWPHLDRALELDSPARAFLLAELEDQQPEMARSVSALLAEIERLNASGFMLNPPLWQAEDLASAVALGGKGA